MTRLALKPGECALILTSQGPRIRGDHTLSDKERRVLISKLTPEIEAIPTPERGKTLYRFYAGDPHEIEISDDWQAVLSEEDTDEQTTLIDYAVDIETYLRNEIEKAVPRAVEEYRNPF